METISCDVLVIGSGASGMTTATTARHFGSDVLVVEKEVVFGGTTARSGGWLWVPLNPLARQAGVSDSLARARNYIQHQAGNHFDETRVAAFLENAGPMVGFLAATPRWNSRSAKAIRIIIPTARAAWKRDDQSIACPLTVVNWAIIWIASLCR